MGARHTDHMFSGSGEMAQLMRARNWSETPLGAADTWPNSLRTIVRVLLTSRFAMWMGWGPELTFFYNDAYRAMTLGAKHPWALGRPSREVWAEIWPQIGPRIERVLTTGDATWDEDLLLFLERSGFREETYHTFWYSPIANDDGAIRGILCVVTEATERVISERRLALVRDAAAGIAATNTEPELFAAVGRTLDTEARDLPFTLTYLVDEESTQARLVCRTGIGADHPAAPPALALSQDDAFWPVREALADPAGATVDLAGLGPDMPAGPWPEPPQHALVVPIAQQGQKGPAGVFVAALNPFRPFDEAYRSFVNLLVTQVAAGLANARAYEQERRRAEALEEIDRAKTTFFSNVSHEFRTPLTLLMGPLDDLRRGSSSLPAAVRDQLDLAHRNSLRLLKLVNTLLDFSRIEAGRVRARFEPLDLCELTTDLASTFRSAMEKAGLEFRVACERIADPTYVDRDMWEKIVLNLVSNAFKFTLNGAVAVTLAKLEQRAVLTVEDTGAGIPEQELSRVFERFHRVEGTQGRSHEGSGIGLALVHELVKLHGGTLSVESEVGRGSRFTITIPLGSAHLPPEHVAASASSARASEASPYVEEALRWLSAPSAPGATWRRRSPASGPRASPVRPGASCSPTTTPTCAITRAGCWLIAGSSKR